MLLLLIFFCYQKSTKQASELPTKNYENAMEPPQGEDSASLDNEGKQSNGNKTDFGREKKLTYPHNVLHIFEFVAEISLEFLFDAFFDLAHALAADAVFLADLPQR